MNTHEEKSILCMRNSISSALFCGRRVLPAASTRELANRSFADPLKKSNKSSKWTKHVFFRIVSLVLGFTYSKHINCSSLQTASHSAIM